MTTKKRLALSIRVKQAGKELWSEDWKVTRRGNNLTITSREGTPRVYTSRHEIEYDFGKTRSAEELADSHIICRNAG
jgi:hypothetical protein